MSQLPPLNFPTDFDSTAYYSFLASAYNQPSLWKSSVTTWDSLPGPIYFTLQIFWMKIVGFSYQNALIFQSLLVLFLFISACVLIMRQVVGAPLSRVHPWAWSLFFCAAVGILASSGFLTAPSNLLDFRLELVPCLLLVLALASLPLRNAFTSAIIAVAACERFHNLPVILLTCAVWAPLAREAAAGDAPARFGALRSLWVNLRFPALGLLGLALLRGPQLYDTALYYSSHFGLDSELRGFGGWRSPGYFSFYPNGLIDYYVGPVTAALLATTGLSLALAFRSSGGREVKRAVRAIAPLMIGGLVAFVLLLIDPTRNNLGVLRYALTPIVFAWIGLVPLVMPRHRPRNVSVVPVVRMAAAFMTVGLAVTAGVLTARDLARIYAANDNRGIRRNDLVGQVDAVYATVYAHAAATKTEVSFGSTFNNEYNLHPGQWQIFLASHNLPPITYRYSVGTAFYSENFAAEQLPLLSKTDYLAVGSEGCLVDGIPLNKDFRVHQAAVRAAVENSCHRSVGTIALDGCSIDVLQCGALKDVALDPTDQR